MRAKRLLFVLAGIVLVGSIGVAIYLLARPSPEETGTTPADIPRAEAPAEVKQLEAAFNSPDVTVQSQVLAPGLDEQYRQQGRSPFGPDVKVVFDYVSYRQGDDCARIDATLSTGEKYVVHLVKQDDRWFIWNTEKGHNEQASC